MTKDGTSVVVTTPGTFSMPASNVTISVTVTDLWGVSADPAADGSADHPYVITNAAGLDLLAQRVNSGTGYGGTYFKLMNDIAYPYATDWDDADSQENNFTRIGDGFWSFYGTFDGQGHTISGIRIYSSDNNQGLFGYINGGCVRNVILADARITGKYDVGGIAGNNGGTIEICHVTANVLIGATGDNTYYHGGIVGYNDGTVDGCTSSATLSQAKQCGGIVGYNQSNKSVVKNCLAIGVTIYGNNDVGAIVGSNEGGTLSHNYYSECTVDGNTGNIGCGYPTGDITANDGAVPAVILSETQASMPTLAENNKVVFRREFTGGKASTVCLPFDIDATQAAAAGKFYTFVGVDKSGAEWEVIMQETSPGNLVSGALSANTPYLFKPAATGPVLFHGTADYDDTNLTTTDTEGWEFTGTYEKKTWASGQTRLYGFAAADFEKADGTLLNDVGSFQRYNWGYCDAFRCYLWAPDPNAARGVSAAGSPLPESMKVRIVSASGEAAAIGTLDTRTGEVTFDGEAWYGLDGRRLNGKPTKKGMYIHNGKTVVIKD